MAIKLIQVADNKPSATCFSLERRNDHMFMPFLKDESGATAIEYGLIVGFIFLAIVSGIHYYTDQTEVLYNKIGTAVAGASR